MCKDKKRCVSCQYDEVGVCFHSESELTPDPDLDREAALIAAAEEAQATK